MKNNKRNLESEFELVKKLLKLQRYSEAEIITTKILEASPNNIPYLSMLSLIHLKKNELKSAEKTLLRILSLSPNDVNSQVNLITLYFRDLQFDKVKSLVSHIKKNNEIKDYNYYLQIAKICHKIGDYLNAKFFFHKSISLNPDDRRLKFFLSQTLLALGEWREGWNYFEYRIGVIVQNSIANCTKILRNEIKYWQGENLNNKKILIFTEQGYGDFIQFYKLIYEIYDKYKSVNITLICKTELIRVINEPNINIIEESNKEKLNIITADYWIFLMSIPYLLRLERENFNISQPYIFPSNRKMKALTEIDKKRLKIGIVLKGNANHPNDANRSIDDFKVLEPLLNIENIDFYSLQKDTSPFSKTIFEKYRIKNLSNQINDFRDTADIISRMDLIISVDTSVVHLAGSMGINCFVLVPIINTDWRWLSLYNFYKSVKIFKQDKPNSWVEPILKIKKEIENLINLS